MKLLSVQVGPIKEVDFNGQRVTTGIFKDPVNGPVQVKKMGIESDRQADLKVHGGIDKAVYAFSHDVYTWWQAVRPQDEFPYGAFGENLTIDLFDENDMYIGDRFEIGSTILEVAQPRFPCFKLGIKFNDPAIIKTFMDSKRPGVYFRVIQEGSIEAGQPVKRVDRESTLLSIGELFAIGQGGKVDRDRAQKYLSIKALPANFRAKFERAVNNG